MTVRDEVKARLASCEEIYETAKVRVIDNYKPDFASYEEYFAFVDSLNLDVDAVCHEDGKTTLTYANAGTEKEVTTQDEPL